MYALPKWHLSLPACMRPLLAAGFALSLSLPGHGQATERISVSAARLPGQVLGNSSSSYPSLSADGRYVAFQSHASNLVPGDTNVSNDIFVADRQTGTIERVSTASDGTQGNSSSFYSSISADGRYVAFSSHASNLVPGDTNGDSDVFVKDRLMGTLQCASTASDGTLGNGFSGYNSEPALSADGRYVAFDSNATNLAPGGGGILVKDRQTGAIERVDTASDGTPGNNASFTSSLSSDGRYVAFESYASNLVPGDTNGKVDVFVKDRQTGTIERISTASDGTQSNDHSGIHSLVLSADGRYIAFTSSATNLLPGDTNGYYDVFVKDRQTKTIERISTASDGTQGNYYSFLLALSADGRYVAFGSRANNLVPGDTNDTPVPGYHDSETGRDVFVKDRQTGATERVSTKSDGNQANLISGYGAALSADGRYVAFGSAARNLVPGDTNGVEDVFVKDRQTNATELVVSYITRDGNANANSSFPILSADGRYIAFVSSASNLVPGDTNHSLDVFVKDRQTGALQRVSTARDGTEGNDISESPALSANRRYVAFASRASNLVPGDTNGTPDPFSGWDIFIKDRLTGVIERVSTASDGTQGNNGSGGPALSADGRYVAFSSAASNLVPGDNNGHADVFVKDRLTGAIERITTGSDETEDYFWSGNPSLSADGRYVAFTSNSNNLVPGDTNWDPDVPNSNLDVFVVDRQTGIIERVSTASDGTQGDLGSGLHGSTLSADGRYVVFDSQAPNLVPGDTNRRQGNPYSGWDIFVKDRLTGAIELVSTASDGTQGNDNSGYSSKPALSANGRYVVFESLASNLVPGDTNGATDVFIKDRQTGTIEPVSLASEGTQGNGYSGIRGISLSADGRYVAFQSTATNLVPGDTNRIEDVFVRGPLHASNYISVSGRITLEDIDPDAQPRLLSFTFRPADGSGDVFQSLFLAPDGQFTLTGVPAKEYELHIESLQHLSVNRNMDASSGDVNNIMALLRAGDADDNDLVDVQDLALLIAAFDADPTSSNWLDGVADFDGDLVVSVEDFALFIRNFDENGDP